MQLKDIMTASVEYVPPDAPLRSAAEAMRRSNVGALPVCSSNRVIGIITDRDIATRAVAAGKNINRARVSDAMSPDLVFCYEDDEVPEAARLMEENQIRRLPILTRGRQLAGMVSLADIATRVHDDRLSGEVLERISEPATVSA